VRVDRSHVKIGGIALAQPTPQATGNPDSNWGSPCSGLSPLLGNECTSVGSRGGGLSNMEEPHAPSNTPASHRDVHDLIVPHDSLDVTDSAYSLRLCPATYRPCQPGNRWNSHSRAAHRKPEPHQSIFSKNRREEGHTNLNSQAAPTHSKATERSHRVRRTFSIRLLSGQLRANAHTVATKRYYDCSVQGAVIAE